MAVGPPGVILGVGELPGPAGVGVHVGEEGENVGVSEGVSVGPEPVGELTGVDGVCVAVGTGDSTGDVGNVPGVGGIGVDVVPITVRLPGTKSIAVRVLVPWDTRALHSTAVCPACEPVMLKVNAVPSVVALRP